MHSGQISDRLLLATATATASHKKIGALQRKNECNSAECETATAKETETEAHHLNYITFILVISLN